MKETYFDFEKLDLNPRIISAAKQNGLLSSEGVLYGCSRHCQAGRQLPHADHRQLVAAVAALYCPARLTAQDLLQQEQQCPAAFGCPTLDRAMGGVLRGGSVLEVCGESGVGKTQLALSVAVNAAQPSSQGGRGLKVAYVCTEGQFPSTRLRQMTEALSPAAGPLQHDAIANSILVQHVDDLGSLVACVEHQLPAVVARHQVQVVVVDSVAAPLRAAENLSWTARQHSLHRLGCGLRRLAAQSSCLVLALNQVSARMDVREDLYGLGGTCEVLPALGLAWSNLVTSRLLLRRGAPAAPLPGQEEEEDSFAKLGETAGGASLLSSSRTDHVQEHVLPSDRDRRDITALQKPTAMTERNSSPSHPTPSACNSHERRNVLQKCCHGNNGSRPRGDACRDGGADGEGRTCVKRARVLGGPALEHEALPSAPGPGQSFQTEALHSTAASKGPPPSVRTLQVVSCPWMPRRSVGFEVRREGIRGVS